MLHLAPGQAQSPKQTVGITRLAAPKLSLLVLLLIVPLAAHAQGSPFDTGLNSLQTLFTGTVAKVASLIAIVMGGYGFAHGDPGAKKNLAGVADRTRGSEGQGKQPLPADFRNVDRTWSYRGSRRDHSGRRHDHNQRIASVHERSGGRRLPAGNYHTRPLHSDSTDDHDPGGTSGKGLFQPRFASPGIREPHHSTDVLRSVSNAVCGRSSLSPLNACPPRRSR